MKCLRYTGLNKRQQYVHNNPDTIVNPLKDTSNSFIHSFKL